MTRPKKSGLKKKYHRKEWLSHQYNNLKKSLPSIAKECAVDIHTIRYFMIKFGINRRTLSQSTNGILKKGGRHCDKAGYVHVFSPTHPFAILARYVLEHRLVMEGHIGRTLLPTEVVHHINRVKDDNRIENLMLFPGNGEHVKHHGLGKAKRRMTKCE
jgi:hypothetical protein